MSDSIELRFTPDVPGLVFRRLRGKADLPALAAVHAGREAHDQIDSKSPNQRTPTTRELATLFLRNPQFNPDAQLLIAAVAGQVVGYAWIRTWAASENEWVLEHAELLLPAWRGKGIGMAMLGWAEDVLGYAAQQRPPGIVAHYQSAVISSERETIVRLEAAGYTSNDSIAALRLDTLDPLPAPTCPHPITLCAPTSEECREAYFTLQAIFHDAGMLWHVEEDAFIALMLDNATDPTLWRVAWANSEAVGIILCEIRENVGVVSEFGVIESWRGQGVGHAVLLSGLHALRERGAHHALVYTDGRDSNAACKLYERVGFRVQQHIREYVKPVE